MCDSATNALLCTYDQQVLFPPCAQEKERQSSAEKVHKKVSKVGIYARFCDGRSKGDGEEQVLEDSVGKPLTREKKHKENERE